MLGPWGAAVALAGDVYVVQWSASGRDVTRIASTSTGDGPIVTWEDQPVELLALADLSGSISRSEAFRMGDTIEALHAALLARPVEGDQLGVTAFGGETQRWIPLGATTRPELGEWVRAF